jgi:competence protein ComEA
MDRSVITAGSLALGATVLALVVWPARPEPPPLEIVSTHTERTVTIHVSGAVVRPGLVTLDADARVADAVLAAGGATLDASLGDLNLAATVGDGTRLVVPYRQESGASGVTGDGLVRINAASVDDLQELPGVGPVLAGRIVAYREANGSFEEVEDLLDVPGIGETKLAALRDSILVP